MFPKTISDSDVWLAGVGASEAADAEGEELFLKLVERGRRAVALELAGDPLRVVTADDLRDEPRVRIATQAIARIWQQPMLEPGQAAVALGAKASNREKVRSLRRRSWLLGLERDRGYLYPAFQVDVGRRELHPEVREVNAILGAAEDPWAVASWWVSSHDRLGTRPVDLVGSARAGDLIAAAKAASSPVG